MEFLDHTPVDHFGTDARQVTLNRGDLLSLYNTLVDYLMVSSRPRDYDPAQGGWIEQLYGAGIAVADLERSPAVDFRPHLPCWISTVAPAAAGWPFKRLLVFEPEDAAETAGRDVWMAFQALRLFTGGDGCARVAATVLSTAPGEADHDVMLRMMFFASVSLAARGPWPDIALCVDAEHQSSAQALFAQLKGQYQSPPTQGIGNPASPVLPSGQASLPQDDPLRWTPAEVGLTQRQYALVQAYTGNLYWYVNRALRAGSVTDPLFVQYHASIEGLSTALGQLRNAAGVPVKRYLNIFEGIEDIYATTLTVVEAAYSSTTKNIGSPTVGDYNLLLKHWLGKDVSGISVVPNEQEVLFDFGMHHLISAIDETVEDGRIRLYLTTDEVLPNTAHTLFNHL